MEPDTLSLRDACARIGVSYSMGKRLAQGGHPLADGVRIIRIGAPTSDRPIYRVAKAQLDQLLQGEA